MIQMDLRLDIDSAEMAYLYKGLICIFYFLYNTLYDLDFLWVDILYITTHYNCYLYAYIILHQ